MTVAVQTPEVSFAGDGSSTEFAVPFRYDAGSNLRALLRDSEGAETTLTNGIDFSAANGPTNAGGTLTMVSAPDDGTALVIWRDTAKAQTEDYIENGPFTAEAHEGALDKLMLLAQEAALDQGRALTVARGEEGISVGSVAARQNRYFRFDNSGNPSFVSLTELAVLLEPEKKAGQTLAFTELTGPRSQLDAYNSDGVDEGGYWIEFSTNAAVDFTRAYAKVYAGDGSCDVRVIAGGLVLWSTTGLDSTPVDEVIAATLNAGDDLIFVIENIVGTVTGVVVKLEGDAE